jgi:hypothetical protein
MRAGWCVSAVAATSVMVGCQPDEKIVHYKPFMAGLEGVQTQTPAVAEKPRMPLATSDAASAAGKDALVITKPDGSKTLISRCGLHLMHHIQQTLADGDDKLFAEQVLSQLTRDEYAGRGVDPREAFRTLKPREKEIAKLFSRMPLGENSPNINMSTVGHNIFRIQLVGQAAKGLDGYTGFDMVLEKGNWKLRWFVS